VLLIVFLVGVFAGTPTPSTAASERDAQAMTILQRMLDDYHRHSYGGYPVGAGLAVAGAVAVGTAVTAAAFQSLSCPMTPMVVGGYTYYQCGSTWYQPAYQGSQVHYVVVNPPQ
jgi:hypothetical protein